MPALGLGCAPGLLSSGRRAGWARSQAHSWPGSPSSRPGPRLAPLPAPPAPSRARVAPTCAPRLLPRSRGRVRSAPSRQDQRAAPGRQRDRAAVSFRAEGTMGPNCPRALVLLLLLLASPPSLASQVSVLTPTVPIPPNVFFPDAPARRSIASGVGETRACPILLLGCELGAMGGGVCFCLQN